MVFCSSCGATVPEAARFCRACGARQEAAGTPPRPPAPSPAPAPAPASPPKARPGDVTAVAVFLILFGVGAFFSLVVGLALGYSYGWTPWLTYNLALALYFMPANIVMAVGLLTGRPWGWKLTVASLFVLVVLSLPPLLSGLTSTASAALAQILIALPLFLYLARSRGVRAHFGAEGTWRWVGGYGASLKREARKRETGAR
ncbi:MAG: zinc ribbon domain-containing protein [Halobacteria archaeon]